MKLHHLILISLVLLAFGFWNRNELPKANSIHQDITISPIQKKIKHSEFGVNVDGKNYFIQPLYDYELYGMVVSYKLHNADTGMHLRSGDHLNVADYCVVWSDSAFEKNLNEIEFWNQEWTCYWQVKDSRLLSSYDRDKLSNNHLITGNSEIRDRIKKINIGDQIRIKGWLSNYRSDKGFIRGTSTVRNDTGNGACETIYVNDIQVIRKHITNWRILMYLSLAVFLASLILYFTRPYTYNK
ncbi:MAG: hypothetical protein QS721_13735 [Candidatus Endonucleobacter sp. (ex Gigantidas childressi)]|nr:hypothetical protein [Candidatus Endonucleobacter sp. (ex Gigantidas childressi)]